MMVEGILTMLGVLAMQGHVALPGPIPEGSLPIARAADVKAGPRVKSEASLGVEVTASSAFVIDVGSGQILYERDAHALRPIASITKLMTAMTFLDSKPDLTERVEIVADDLTHEGKSPLRVGQRYTKGDLLSLLLVGSVNDAGRALARASGGLEVFVEKMNSRARVMGLRLAHFTDPTGLNAKNVATAAEVALLLKTAMRYPILENILHQEKVMVTSDTGETGSVESTNVLLSSFLNKKPYKILAAKTGSLMQAGFCLAQATQGPEGQVIIAVALDSADHFSRYQDVKSLTYWAMHSFEWGSIQ
jgi:D-alanyl-D-alanine endopeptidase (penicillin-binding protein 7)